MGNLNKKAKWAIGLSVVAIILSGVMLIMWCCNAGGFKAVELDTFVGVIVALLAIIVTIAIGWQIYAAMDLKSNIAKLDSRIQEVESLKEQFGQQQRTIDQLTLKTRHTISYTWGKSCVKEEDWFHAFRFLLASLDASLQLDSPMNISMIFKYLKIVAKNIKPHTKCSKKRHQEVVQADKSIRSLHNFAIIEDEYLELYNKIFAKIKIDDDQK